jgi:malonyl-CoA/methylmalonyl-CoA synthetase
MPDEGNLIDTFHAAAAGRLDEPFLCESGRPDSSYRDVFRRAEAMAAVLFDHGVTPGDRILVRVDKSRDAVALYLACLHAGSVHVPLNPAFTRDELAYFVADAEPALVVLDDARLAYAPNHIRTTGLGELVADAVETVDSSVAATTRTGADLAALLYTSGTTGRPKGAALTHDSLRHNARALHRAWRFDTDDRLLHSLPIFHVHGLFVALHCAMLSAIPVTFLPRFDIDAVIGALPDSTVFMGVPTHYTRLLADPRFDRARTAGVRLFTSGSAPLPDAVFDTFSERTGHRICERYGMSETGIITTNPYDGDRIAGTVGFPLPGTQIRVSDDEGRPVATETTGTIEVRGPHLFDQYWQRPAATDDAHREGGWFITGDIGSVDDEGRLTLQGRAGDMIISGGENIYPKEIELVLDTVPGVVESAVIGLPHSDLGECVTAVLVVDDDYRAASVDRRLGESLARFKHPLSHIVIDELPRNAMGKIQKHDLRRRFADHYDVAT